MMVPSDRLNLVALLAVSLAACSPPLSPSELIALAEAEARWAARGFDDYAVEMRQACFCPDVVVHWARVEVVNGAVSRVFLLESATELPSNEHGYFPTVEQLFNSIRRANDVESLEDVEVAFDPELGFPTTVSFRSNPEILDGGGAYYLRSAGPIL